MISTFMTVIARESTMSNYHTQTAQEIRFQLERAACTEQCDTTTVAVSLRAESTAKAQCLSVLARLGMTYEEEQTVYLPTPPGNGSAVIYMTLHGPFEQRVRAANLIGKRVPVFGVNILTPPLTNASY